MADETYNGWTNYETWAVNLWLTNGEIPHRRLKAIAQASHQLGIDKDNHLREWVEGMNPLDGGMFNDLVTHALGRVNWKEIIDSV